MSDGFFLPAEFKTALRVYLGKQPYDDVQYAVPALEQLQPGQPLEPQEAEEEQDA